MATSLWFTTLVISQLIYPKVKLLHQALQECIRVTHLQQIKLFGYSFANAKVKRARLAILHSIKKVVSDKPIAKLVVTIKNGLSVSTE